jgi:hypothetical protein
MKTNKTYTQNEKNSQTRNINQEKQNERKLTKLEKESLKFITPRPTQIFFGGILIQEKSVEQ